MDKKRYEIYLGALLHDIGKLIFRSMKHEAGLGHEVLGEQFIREYLGKIRILKDDIENVIRESKHHKTPTYCGIADRINAAERMEDGSKETRRYLLSILKEINLEGDSPNPSKGLYYYYPQAIGASNVFPDRHDQYVSASDWVVNEEESISKHERLVETFKEDLLKLEKAKGYEQLAYSLYYLLEKYTSKVASSAYLTKPDISLFDHSRSTAGLVNCLTVSIPEIEIKSYATSPPNLEFILLKGDLSGIQKFIYSDIDLSKTGQSKGLAKKLRGRSIYVSLLTDVIAEEFARQFDMAESNILFTGGGHFTLVMPYHKGIEDELKQLEAKINLMLIQKISSNFSLVLGIAKCDQTLYQSANKTISKANYELSRAKYKKHEEYLEQLFYQEAHSQSFEEDSLIGKAIPYAKYLVQLSAKNKDNFKGDSRLIASFPEMNTYFFTSGRKESDKGTEFDHLFDFFDERKDKIDSARLIKLNDTDFLQYADKLNSSFDFPIAYGFRFIGNSAPIDKDGLMEFSEVASLQFRNNGTNHRLNYPLMGIIRLDVDNLGGIFGVGLGDSVSFSRIATLSREFNQFFSGYFNELASRYQLYITYSGGDDAFLIGSWYNVLHFAKQLYDDFRKFTCYNPDITFSAGIFICDSNFPIAKFAERTAELEERSKQYIDPLTGRMKNAVTVFDHTLTWDRYCTMIEFSDKLLSYTEGENIQEKGKLARSLVHRILRLIKSCLDSKGRVDTEKLYRNVAQLHYLFARHGYNEHKISQTKEGLTKDIISLILKDFKKTDLIKDYLIPFNYVILKTRK